MLADAARSLVVTDAAADPAFARRPTTVNFGIGAYSGVLLHAADGTVYGTLCTLHSAARTPIEGEIALLGLAGQMVMHAVETDRRMTHERTMALELVDVSERLHAVHNAMACGVLIVDDAGRLIEVNDAARQLLGPIPDSALGRPLAEAPWQLLDTAHRVLPPAEYPSMRALQSGKPQRAVQLQVRHGDGRIRWIHLDAVPVRGAEHTRWVVSSFVETTRMRQAEAALSASEARFRALTEHSSDLVCVLATDGAVRYESPSFARLLGEPLAAIHARHGTALAVVHPDDRAAVQAAFEAARMSGASTTIEWRLRATDGSWRTFECSASDCSNDPAIDGIVLTNRDISERVAADAALRAREASLRRLVATAPVGMAVSTPDGRLEEVNEAYCAVFGYTREELIGQPASMVIAPESRTASIGVFADRMRDDAEATGDEWTAVTRRGERRTVLASGLTMEWADGAARRVSFTVDITERKQQERRLAELAHYDRLTGLPNRALFTERLEAIAAQLRERGRGFAVLFADLDGFKAANDAHGHSLGDLLLQVAGERLVQCARDGDTVARMGGDEFTAILVDIDNPAVAGKVATRMVAALDRPFLLDGRTITLSGSIGVALAPRDGTEPGTLLRAADAAMYAAKRAGKHRHAFAHATP